MDLRAPLVAPLQETVDAFLHEEVVRVCHQAAELEISLIYPSLRLELVRACQQVVELELDLSLHQARMKEVCYSIKAHYLWENFEWDGAGSFAYCWLCQEEISPEIDMGRHTGLCKMREEEEQVCASIKAHCRWKTRDFPGPSHKCWNCGETISPEFSLLRHWGRCKLKDTGVSCLYPYELTRAAATGPTSLRVSPQSPVALAPRSREE